MSSEQTFSYSRYLFRRKVFKLFGGEFSVYDPTGGIVLYSKQKAFKLKEDIRVYSDKSMATELLTMKARQIIDFAATYDVVDSRSGAVVGALRRKGWKSMVKDEWLFFDPQGQEISKMQEERLSLALIRRLFGLSVILSPQKYIITLRGQSVAFFKQHHNPFVLKYDLDLSQDYKGKLDRRIAIAAGILLCAIEGRQHSLV